MGGFEKPRIREIAEELGLGVAGKKDSQEICFVTQGHHSDFVRAREPDRSADTGGEIVTVEGKVVGEHQGYEAFTVGQRKGIGIAATHPLYVQRTDPGRRLVVVGSRDALGSTAFQADDATWLGLHPAPGETVRGRVQVRAHGETHWASITATGLDSFEATFDAPTIAVAGQAAVVYDEADEAVLFSGWIHSAR